MTKHGEERIRERCGLPKKAVNKMAETAFQKGLNHSDCTGRLGKYLDNLFFNGKGWGYIKLYAEKVWIYTKEQDLITVFNIPSPHKSAFNKIMKRRSL